MLETTAGLSGCSRLRKTNFAANRIPKIDDLGTLKNLHSLDLSDNLLERMNHVRCLGLNASLRNLQLKGNPVAKLPNYRLTMFQIIPKLRELDNETSAYASFW
jgi:Leucine-rich repeat (LRR) protein